jgi:hypothetical protein
MKFSKIVFALVSALIVKSSALEGKEEACPDYDGAPDCEACVSARCGYVIDEGDCVKDCATVPDSECFSFNVTSFNVTKDICAKAAAAIDALAGGGRKLRRVAVLEQTDKRSD